MQLFQIFLMSVLFVMGALQGCSQHAGEPTPTRGSGYQVETVKKGNENSLVDFLSQEFGQHVNATGVQWKTLTSDDGHPRLMLHFNAQQFDQPTISLESEKGWDLSANSEMAFLIPLENSTSEPIHLHISVVDKEGKKQNRNVAVPPYSSDTYYFMVSGVNVDTESGIRSNPKNWDTGYKQIIWRHGDKQINSANIAALTFAVMGAMKDKHLLIGNITAISPTKLDDAALAGIADKYGQNAKQAFVGKVGSDDDLVANYRQETQRLSGEVWDERSQYGGWKAGPQLDATGYFRTTKHQGKWALVDPEGYLFFSTGIANVRMANTSTITGYDVPDGFITPREPGDLTPEDSIGLNRMSNEAAQHRFVASELRANMFKALPDYPSKYGAFYGYRRTVHTGALQKGETYSFYMANLARKFGTTDETALMDKWEKLTLDRMMDWGFTSFGNWIDTRFYDDARFPYFANGWIIGDFATVSTGNDYWSPIPDPFDDKFIERADITVKTISEEVKNSPWCVGVFIDNEKSWGMMNDDASRFALVKGTLALNSHDSPAKAAFVQWLKNDYSDLSELNRKWGQQFETWSEVEKGFTPDFNVQSAKEDYSALLALYAEQYFRVVSESIDHYLPNHLYMGARFASWGMTPELRAAAAKYADVISYNYYREGLNPVFWDFLDELDKPSIIGEFHIGALDSGLLNPGLIGAHTQTIRGQMYQTYMNSVIDNPYFVGAHWFQYIDSPLTGRAYDGENYNVGFVSVADVPYAPLIDAVKSVNKTLYPRRFEQ